MTTATTNEQGLLPHVVCILGASAGGLAPIEEFFEGHGQVANTAFVVVQHLSPEHDSQMGPLLSAKTDMPVVEATADTPLHAGHVYLLAPGTELSIEPGRLVVSSRPTDRDHLHRPIDQAFRSASLAYESRAVAIVLSGTGTDGAAGVVDIAANGGLILVQDESALFNGMPLATAELALHDAELAPTEMASAVAAFALEGIRPGGTGDVRSLRPDEALVINELEALTNMSFAQYRAPTIRRRLAQRAARADLSLTDYAAALRSDADERDALMAALLIDVTSFFRDPEVFATLERDVLPQLAIEAASEGRSLRVWVPGCSSGEEAYSLGMSFLDTMGNIQGPAPELKIFATDLRVDVNTPSQAKVYTDEQVGAIGPARRDRYFVRTPGGWTPGVELRSMVTFAKQNLIEDPPFTRIDLVSCRNLLIYFRDTAQGRAQASMNFALRDGGVLVQGTSEHLGRAQPDYEPISSTWRIWRKTGDSIQRAYRQRSMLSSQAAAAQRVPALLTDQKLLRAYDALLEEQLSAGVLVTSDRELIHTFGLARDWLRQPSGRPTNDLMLMVEDQSLRMTLAAVLRDLDHGNQEATPRLVVFPQLTPPRHEGSMGGDSEAASDGDHDSTSSMMLSAKTIRSGTEVLYLVYSTPVVEPIRLAPDVTPLVATSEDHVRRLEAELALARESMHAALAEQATADEELNATNEELVASNEELQSTNEELSSVNEELRTLNDEHRRRLAQVLDLSADLEQLMSSTDIAVVFLAEDMTIRRFNEPARRYFRVRNSDVGRPFEDLHSLIDAPTLHDDIVRASETGHGANRRVRHSPDSDTPLRELVVQVDRYELPRQRWGVFVAVVDISEVVTVADQEKMLASFLSTAPVHMAIWDADGRWAFTNSSLRTNLAPHQLIGKQPHDVYAGDLGAVIEQENREVLVTGESMSKLQMGADRLSGSAYAATKFPFTFDGKPAVGGIALSASDMPELVELSVQEHAVHELTASGAIAVMTWDADGRLADSYRRTDDHEQAFRVVAEDWPSVGEAVRAAISQGRSSHCLVRVQQAHGAAPQWREFRVTPVDDGRIAAIGVTIDVDSYVRRIARLRTRLADLVPEDELLLDEHALLDLTTTQTAAAANPTEETDL